MPPVWWKHIYSVLCALAWRPISAAARSRLCSRVFFGGRCICQKRYVIAVVSVVQIVLFRTIEFSLSSIWPIDRALSSATTPGRSELGSDVNKWAIRIPQSSSITGIWLFSFISRTTVWVGGSYLSAKKQSVHSTAPADYEKCRLSLCYC